ncbi:MerR family transcriptional regulator [Enterococcus hermanniensis]|uniref:HTH merR-type domain-containing protein n=1 Tax=Enterococcus hermanniensis TaxID=249189 RepID=A0A1L8TLV4_9ENTE|nr:MerR family transcriptional regulator [Enterococcus hermanniensis]OJG45276.1 hypothetical protein RV04_GL002324 [Enterococcus hermanniensis]
MNYSIKQMAGLSGVSTRTLRFYDEKGLLKPAFLSKSGYRFYTELEVERLQQILLYRSMEISLNRIKVLLDQSQAEIQQTLLEQKKQLEKKKQEIEEILVLLDDTINDEKGEKQMTDQEKFSAFKKTALAENERQYGNEIRSKYGEEVVESTNQMWSNLSKSDYQTMQLVEEKLFEKLSYYRLNADNDVAKEVFQLHKQWLLFSWGKYSSEAHIGLAKLYISDHRFTQYYDERVGQGTANTLAQIIFKEA